MTTLSVEKLLQYNDFKHIHLDSKEYREKCWSMNWDSHDPSLCCFATCIWRNEFEPDDELVQWESIDDAVSRDTLHKIQSVLPSTLVGLILAFTCYKQDAVSELRNDPELSFIVNENIELFSLLKYGQKRAVVCGRRLKKMEGRDPCPQPVPVMPDGSIRIR